jgi:hypothetical protein
MISRGVCKTLRVFGSAFDALGKQFQVFPYTEKCNSILIVILLLSL